MRKFPKLKYPRHTETDGVLHGKVAVTEKLDGANFRFGWEDGLVVGTRNHTYEPHDPNLPTAFEHAVEYVEDQLVKASNSFMSEFQSGRLTFFGEAMHYHSLKYQDVDYVNPSSGSPYFGGDNPNVVLFDIWDEEEGEWLNWNEVENIVSKSPFELTGIIARGGGEQLKEDGWLQIPNQSMFGGQPEGIVVRRYDGMVRAKKVSEDFKEQNAQAFNDPNKAASEAGKFVAAFVTDARIEKQANKLVDEGKYEHLHMSMMEDLPREVLKDVFEEVGWSELLNGDFEAEWDDDFKAEVRSKASKKCSRVLKQMAQEF